MFDVEAAQVQAAAVGYKWKALVDKLIDNNERANGSTVKRNALVVVSVSAADVAACNPSTGPFKEYSREKAMSICPAYTVYVELLASPPTHPFFLSITATAKRGGKHLF